MKPIKFKQWLCDVQLGQYSNGRLAISLVSAVQNDDIFLGEPIATATVNVPDIDIVPSEVILKNYSENSGMLEVLQQAGLVGYKVRVVKSDFVDFHIVDKTELLQKMENEAQSLAQNQQRKKKLH